MPPRYFLEIKVWRMLNLCPGNVILNCTNIPPRRFHARGCGWRNAGGGGKLFEEQGQPKESYTIVKSCLPGVFGMKRNGVKCNGETQGSGANK